MVAYERARFLVVVFAGRPRLVAEPVAELPVLDVDLEPVAAPFAAPFEVAFFIFLVAGFFVVAGAFLVAMTES